MENKVEMANLLDAEIQEPKLEKTMAAPEQNVEEMQEIITDVPAWIVRWGVTMVSAILLGIILMSSLIHYPDVIRTHVKITGVNAPKIVLCKRSGKLIKILIRDGEFVNQKQPLAYLESTADHEQVLQLLGILISYRKDLKETNTPTRSLPANYNLGELQAAYQKLFDNYLLFIATDNNGYVRKQASLLKNDLTGITKLRKEILRQQEVQQQEYKNIELEYFAYKKLFENKVISRSEFLAQENKYFSSKHPVQQSNILLIDNDRLHISREKDVLEINNLIRDAKAKFEQSLNQYISETETWVSDHILRASITGHASFAGVLQQNQNLTNNQEVFIISPGKSNFFGEINIPQYNMGNVQLGADVIIKMQSFPYEQFGVIQGKVLKIADVAYKDSVFSAQVSLNFSKTNPDSKKFNLKNGMIGDAEIITADGSLLDRFVRSFRKINN